ncbi:MAG TPA: DUF2339 domain-containing protein [Planctomycetota bacterium]|nr:DUF2339 domain-containing protein [Planctomycetota bacterium]
MDGCGGGLLALLGLGLVVLPFVLLGVELASRARLSALERRLSLLEKEDGSRRGLARTGVTPAQAQSPGVEVPGPPPSPPSLAAPPPTPPLPPPPLRPSAIESPPAPKPAAVPAFVPAPQRALRPAAALAFRLEDFLGVKLFAWIGAVLAFLAVAFFVKYSFDNNLVRPPVRIAIGILVGLGTLGIGLHLDRARYRFLIQALSSASILIFYGTLFASYRLYDLIPQPVVFGLMVLVTVAAFTLAVRLNAMTVAVLGLVGGFMTPPLLSTGVDHALALFTYVALLDVGLVAVGARQRWSALLPLAVAGTAFLQLGWVDSFLTLEKVPTAFSIFAFFPALFAAAFLLLRRSRMESGTSLATTLVPSFLSLLFGLGMVAGPLGMALSSPGLLGLFLFAVDLALLLPAVISPRLRAAVPLAGLAIFAILAIWIGRFLDTSSLPILLFFVLLFALLHGVLPVVLERLRPGSPGAGAWGHAFAPLALLLVLEPIHHLPGPPPLLWPFILVLGGAALLTAWATGQILGFAGTIVLAVAALGISLLRLPVDAALPLLSFVLIGGFAVLFHLGASALLRSRPEARNQGAGVLPALSALLPFALLILAASRLAVPDPSPLFGLAALLGALVLGASLVHRGEGPLGVLLAAIVSLEFAWHGLRFQSASALIPAAWYAAFFLGFVLLPFVAPKRWGDRPEPWIVAALAGPLQFFLLFRTAQAACPALPRALISLAFAAVYVLALARLARMTSAAGRTRSLALALLGGVALLFLTAAIPIQFDRQWITVGWALEGVAILWLFRRIPHEGLRIGGLLLLGATFVRLLPGINPYLLGYAERGPAPLLNWFLYTYGIVAACQFIGAGLIDRARPRILDLDARAVLAALGTILTFVLVNVEIADFFSAGERYVVFRFPASLAQDMSYSIAWAMFALGLLVLGVRTPRVLLRYSGLGLLVVTLAKVALYDLWQLGGLYRVGSLVGLAIVLLVVSFLYHRFVEGAAEVDRAGPSPGGA